MELWQRKGVGAEYKVAAGAGTGVRAEAVAVVGAGTVAMGS